MQRSGSLPDTIPSRKGSLSARISVSSVLPPPLVPSPGPILPRSSQCVFAPRRSPWLPLRTGECVSRAQYSCPIKPLYRLFNFALAWAVPPGLSSIAYKTYFIFGTFNFAAFIHIFFCFPETAGRTLEEIEEVFAQGHVFTAWKIDRHVGQKTLDQVVREQKGETDSVSVLLL